MLHIEYHYACREGLFLSKKSTMTMLRNVNSKDMNHVSYIAY